MNAATPGATPDERHLELLANFHDVGGGLIALFACMPQIHVTIGIFLLTGSMSSPNPPPAAVGWLFIVLGSAFSLGGWTLAAGRRLKRRRSRTFCMVIGDAVRHRAAC